MTLEEYSRVQIQGEENLKRVEVGGELVAVLEKRAVDAKREGYFIVQVRMWVCGCVEGVMSDHSESMYHFSIATGSVVVSTLIIII